MPGVEEQLAALEAMTSDELRDRWRRLTGSVVPRVSPAMLRLALAWEIQARAFGGLSRATTAALDQLARGASVTRAPARQACGWCARWQGRVHIVMVGEDQVIRWDDREWRSLSEVARAITGTRWSGPAFFGLKKKVAA